MSASQQYLATPAQPPTVARKVEEAQSEHSHVAYTLFSLHVSRTDLHAQSVRSNENFCVGSSGWKLAKSALLVGWRIFRLKAPHPARGKSDARHSSTSAMGMYYTHRYMCESNVMCH